MPFESTLKISFQALIRVLTRAYKDDPLVITTSNIEHMLWIRVEHTDKELSMCTYNFSTGEAKHFSDNLYPVIKEVVDSAHDAAYEKHLNKSLDIDDEIVDERDLFSEVRYQQEKGEADNWISETHYQQHLSV